MAGLPGAGKSTLAQALAAKTSGTVLDKDQIRNVLFRPGEIEYSSEQDDFCIRVALQTAAYLFGKQPKRVVFLDGRPFSKKEQVDYALNAAVEMQQTWRILECVCSEVTARQRLNAQAGEHVAADRNYDLYLRIQAGWEEIAPPKTVIDTDQPLESCVAISLQAIQG